jgi:AraC-like DNA-binding protein
VLSRTIVFVRMEVGISACGAALKVGYESASQFSREFKCLFGNSPATEVAELRNLFVRM